MARVKQFDKRTGITYVYESTSYWDKEKKQPRSHRTLIGRLDPETGDILPTDGRGKQRRKENQASNVHGHGNHVPLIRRIFYGATYLLEQLSQESGLKLDLQACFPDTWRQILSLCYFMILENGSPFSRFGKWEHFHLHPFGQDITGRQFSALFAGLTNQAMTSFFTLQGGRFPGNNCWAFDITPEDALVHESGIGFSPENSGRKLSAGGNTAFLVKNDSGIPFCSLPLESKLSGIQEAHSLSRSPSVPEGGTLRFILGTSSFREDHLASFLAEGLEFVWGAPVTWHVVKECLHETMPERDHYDFFHGKLGFYVFTRSVAWEYNADMQNEPLTEVIRKMENPARQTGVPKDVSQLYIHLYCDPLRRKEEEQDFHDKITRLRQELLSGHRVPSHGDEYRKYFAARETPDGRYRLVFRQDVIDAAREQFGMMALISNTIRDPEEALRLFRMRETAAKAFYGMNIGFHRSMAETPSDGLEEGFLFTEHVALALILSLQRRMEDAGMMAGRTVRSLLDELDMIECRVRQGGRPIPLRLQDTRDEVYQELGLTPMEK